MIGFSAPKPNKTPRLAPVGLDRSLDVLDARADRLDRPGDRPSTGDTSRAPCSRRGVYLTDFSAPKSNKTPRLAPVGLDRSLDVLDAKSDRNGRA